MSKKNDVERLRSMKKTKISQELYKSVAKCFTSRYNIIRNSEIAIGFMIL